MTSDLAKILPGVATSFGVPGFADPLGITHQIAGARRVALLLLDGMGWHNVPADPQRTPAFHAVMTGRLGTARPISTGFPSTTATSIVSLCTGALAGEHGILGYTLNVPESDRVLVHTRWTDDPDPQIWQPVPSILDALRAADIAVTIVNRPDLAHSGLTQVTTGQRGYVMAPDPEALAEGMIAAVRRERRSFVYGYYSGMDSAAHLHGNSSAQWWKAAETADILVQRLVEGLPPDAALIITADHGQLDIPASRRIDIDDDADLCKGLRVIAGEARVRYLYTEPGATRDVHERWTEKLGSVAQVLLRDQVVERGLFGLVRDQHRARIGDVVAICEDDWALVATKREPAAESRLIGMHGGMTPIEKQIPLITVAGDGTVSA
ncbi:alkaline phosphatase family protein [Catellatospora chokoriensis]|uniref:Alkaline phosphatase family protein n=1 Tax=Catellatospora chokoriensis TaxID=310353 RepID=A0A8J3JZE8_9ACTN|nr:nucleotide pyrophosphatase/phosphodiesterase family protein [Catellatospora chokoriensis]GIF89843.1 alkaline phosphatase family protein [Catellatospora chokoriensis]